MTRILRIAFCIVFFTTVALPALVLVGVRDVGTKLAGWEAKTGVPELTLAGFTNRTFQTAATEDFSKRFFLRKTCLRTSLQLRDWMNFGLFHYGYRGSLLEGRDGILFERPYQTYHLEGVRTPERTKYEKAFATLREMNEFCRAIGSDFAYFLMPDKSQIYPEYLPRWIDWLWDYSEHDVQSAMARRCEENGITAFDARAFLLDLKTKTDKWIFPPAGTHLNALGDIAACEAFVRHLNAKGRSNLKINPLVGLEPIDHEWRADDDIGRLLNMWDTHHVDRNVRYWPSFAQTNVVMNAGSAFLIGDCFRDSVANAFRDSGLFRQGKVRSSKRRGQRPEDLMDIVRDLKLVAVVFQSFNTGDLDRKEPELREIFEALKEARRRADGGR